MGYEQKARDRVGRASQLKYDPAELLLRQEKCPAGVLTSCVACAALSSHRRKQAMLRRTVKVLYSQLWHSQRRAR
jgi:hypothetical protein